MELANKWVITLDDENWGINNYGTFNTESEVLEFINSASAKELDEMWENENGDYMIQEGDEGMFVHYGQIQEYTPSVDAENVLDNISENAYSEVSDYAERYLYNVPKEQIAELKEQLNEVLHKWIHKYKHEPHFYTIRNEREIEKVIEEGE